MHFAPFFWPSEKSALQPARYEAFTKGPKTDPLYDSGVFGFDTKFSYFRHNSLKISMMSLKTARTEGRQNRVTYNNMPFAKPEKRGDSGQPTSICPKSSCKEFLTAKNANHANAFGGKGRQAGAYGHLEQRIKPVAKNKKYKK